MQINFWLLLKVKLQLKDMHFVKLVLIMIMMLVKHVKMVAILVLMPTLV